MNNNEARRTVYIKLNDEEYRTLVFLLGYACGVADERKRNDARMWSNLVERITQDISSQIRYGPTA